MIAKCRLCGAIYATVWIANNRGNLHLVNAILAGLAKPTQPLYPISVSRIKVCCPNCKDELEQEIIPLNKVSK